jgi:hypothetical protein
MTSDRQAHVLPNIPIAGFNHNRAVKPGQLSGPLAGCEDNGQEQVNGAVAYSAARRFVFHDQHNHNLIRISGVAIMRTFQ